MVNAYRVLAQYGHPDVPPNYRQLYLIAVLNFQEQYRRRVHLLLVHGSADPCDGPESPGSCCMTIFPGMHFVQASKLPSRNTSERQTQYPRYINLLAETAASTPVQNAEWQRENGVSGMCILLRVDVHTSKIAISNIYFSFHSRPRRATQTKAIWRTNLQHGLCVLCQRFVLAFAVLWRSNLDQFYLKE